MNINVLPFVLQIRRWLEYANSFHLDSNSGLSKLKNFNENLLQRSVLASKGLNPSVADVIVWISLHDVVVRIFADSILHMCHVQIYWKNNRHFVMCALHLCVNLVGCM